MLYSPLCLVLYGQQQLGCERHKRKGYKEAVCNYILAKFIDFKGKTLTYPVALTFFQVQKETEESIYIAAFQPCVFQIPKCSLPHTVLAVPQKEVLSVPPEKKRFLPFFIFMHKIWQHYHHTRVFHTPLLWARGRFTDIQTPIPPVHIYIPKASDPLQVTRGVPGTRSHCENRIKPQSTLEETGPHSGSASLSCARCGLLSSYSRSSYSALDTPSSGLCSELQEHQEWAFPQLPALLQAGQALGAHWHLQSGHQNRGANSREHREPGTTGKGMLQKPGWGCQR